MGQKGVDSTGRAPGEVQTTEVVGFNEERREGLREAPSGGGGIQIGRVQRAVRLFVVLGCLALASGSTNGCESQPPPRAEAVTNEYDSLKTPFGEVKVSANTEWIRFYGQGEPSENFVITVKVVDPLTGEEVDAVECFPEANGSGQWQAVGYFEYAEDGDQAQLSGNGFQHTVRLNDSGAAGQDLPEMPSY